MPHLLSSLLTQIAVALLEALVMRLLVQLWNAFLRSGRPVAAAAWSTGTAVSPTDARTHRSGIIGLREGQPTA